MRVVVDYIHSTARTARNISGRHGTAYRVATLVCEHLNLRKNCNATMAETENVKGRISVAESNKPECYICFHSNPLASSRENGIAAFVRRGDRKAFEIAEKIMNSISSQCEIKNLGVFENTGSAVLMDAAECTPIIIEMVFNPYGSAYSSYVKKLESVPSAVALGIDDAFKISQEVTDEVFKDFLAENSGNGYLKVQTVAGRSLVPVTNVKIVVSKKLNGVDYVLADISSDMNGMTGPISLPAPPSSLSQTPGGIAPYAVYDVKISREGYQTINNLNVPVFDKVTSIQTARLNSTAVNGEDEINDEAGSQKL